MKRDKKLFKILIFFVLGIIVVFLCIPLIINYLFGKQAQTDILYARWSGGDALNYTAGAIAFLGTMFLGWISWSQNRQLQRIETNSFIAQNSCMVLLESISFRGFTQIATNLDTEHEEPIVKEDDISDNKYSSCILTIFMKRIDSYAAFVKVNSLLMIVEEENIKTLIQTTAYDDNYSRIAISENNSGFELTILLKPDTKKKIIKAVEQESRIEIEIIVELVTANYVTTKLKCTACFHKTDSTNNFIVKGQDPMCYWYGNEIIDSKDVKFRNEI